MKIKLRKYHQMAIASTIILLVVGNIWVATFLILNGNITLQQPHNTTQLLSIKLITYHLAKQPPPTNFNLSSIRLDSTIIAAIIGLFGVVITAIIVIYQVRANIKNEKSEIEIQYKHEQEIQKLQHKHE